MPKLFFTIFHIEFAEKSQKIRTAALWYKKLYKKKPVGGAAPNRVNTEIILKLFQMIFKSDVQYVKSMIYHTIL